MQLTLQGQQFYNFICAEVARFCSIKRVNEDSILELDQKIQMEAYLREKKEAILKDRNNSLSPSVDQNPYEDD